MSNGNVITYVDSLEKLAKYWPLFIEGLTALREPKVANLELNDDEFRKLALRLIFEPTRGALLVLTSKNGKELGFASIIDADCLTGPRSARLLILYSNRKCPSANQELLYDAELWAREHKFQRIEAIAYKEAKFLKEDVFFGCKLKFDKRCVLYYKEL